MQKNVIFVEKESKKILKTKIIEKSESLLLYRKIQGRSSQYFSLNFKVHNEIPAVFHNGSSYDYHFIIKELANEFQRQFECLGENKEKYKTFSVPKIDKDGNESVETISYKIKFIDSI